MNVHRLTVMAIAFFLLFPTLGSTNPMTLPDTPLTLPVLHIDASQRTPLEAGLETGRQAKRLFPDIERRYDAHLNSLFGQSTADALIQGRLPGLLEALDAPYQQELKGVIAAWTLVRDNRLGDGQLSEDEFYLLNLLTDIGQAPAGSGFGVMGKVSAEAGSIIGRNLDWASSPELRSLQTITVYQYVDHSVVNIGFAGLLPVLAGFNDSGVFITTLKAEPYSPYPPLTRNVGHDSSVGFTVRTALDNSHSLPEASRYLLKQQYAASQNILVGDRKIVQVLEYPASGQGKARTWKSPLHTDRPWDHRRQIAVVGCNLLAELPNNCTDAKDIVRWERLQEMARFSPAQPAKVSDVSNILSDTANDGYELFNTRTVQSIIYLPGNSNLFLYAAPVSGVQPAIPAHKAYLELLPVQFRHKKTTSYIDVAWIIWGLLLLKAGLTLWLFRKTIYKFLLGIRDSGTASS